MRAILLAAGRGSRLGAYTDDRPKSLLKFGDRTLIERSLANLRQAGVDQAFVVVGYLRHIMEATIRASFDDEFCRIVVNPDYTEGSGSSLRRAAEFIDGDTLLLEADLLYDGAAIQRMAAPALGNALALGHFGHDHVEGKIRIRDGYVESLFWGASDVQADGDWVGITKLSPPASAALREALRRSAPVAEGEVLHYTSFVFDLVERFPFRAVSIDDVPWIEIDTADDLARAEAEVYPQLVARGGA
jgi:choline kinase